MTDRRPRRHLRDAATMCPHVFDVPGSRQMQCELAPGHEGLHSHGCTRWGSQHSKRPAAPEGGAR